MFVLFIEFGLQDSAEANMSGLLRSRKSCIISEDRQQILKLNIMAEQIETWNVRTIYQSGKIHNAIQEIDRIKIGSLLILRALL